VTLFDERTCIEQRQATAALTLGPNLSTLGW